MAGGLGARTDKLTLSVTSQEEEFFRCPNHCDCSLSSLKKLEIDCKNHHYRDDEDNGQNNKNNNNNNNDNNNNKNNSNNQPYTSHGHQTTTNSSTASYFTSADVTHGIRHLVLRRMTLGSHYSLPSILQFPLRENILNILELHDVTLEPISFFNSHLFRSSRNSLQRLDMNHIRVEPTAPSRDLIENQRSLVHFERLRELDNLTVSDCRGSPYLSQLLLQSLPGVVKHINIRNSSVSELSPQHFSHLRSLRSLDLSQNHLKTIPPTLTENLSELSFLDVSFNSIEHLQEQVFLGLTSLQILNISHNQIRYVDTDVFNPITSVRTIDLSYNDVIQFFEPYFESNSQLTTLRMRSTWTSNTFTNADTSARSRMEMERLLNTLLSVKFLDLRDNEMLVIPETLAHIPTLVEVALQGNRWTCTCQDRWFTHWLATMKVELFASYRNSNRNNNANAPTNVSHQLWCHSGSSTKFPLQEYLPNLVCSDPNIYNRNPSKYYTHMGLNTMLRCHHQLPNGPTITWITPSKQTLRSNSGTTPPSSSATTDDKSAIRHVKVLEDGNLLITNVNKGDFGLYVCIAQYNNLNITHYIHVGVDTSIFSDVRIMSFIIGWATSFAFLLVVIIYHMVRSLLIRCGVECSSMSKNYQSRRVRTFFEGMEQHKNTQLDWLRDNYNMQAKRIKDNCFSQVERIRESYTVQHKNLSDIRDYGTSQLHQLRDQYCDQIRRVSGYSAQQLCKVRENYLFQRNRVCKFSSHQLLRLRETYKWQAQTLNKILENLPRTLNLDTCRGIGTCGRTDSIYLEDISEFQSIDDSDYPPDSINPVRMSHEKLEHVSLLIPPQFMIPPDHPLDFTRIRGVKPSGTYFVDAETENYFPEEASTVPKMETIQSPE
ncbi:unnamed protein product [Allacma fusca]|uniref:Ig-like domain-containing protein n=1 Tax=Allacma fusca TaxID=39272 RepID=A0A8J2JEB0_9HEXA|nr:unnamed protein product [Allacma fusca]